MTEGTVDGVERGNLTAKALALMMAIVWDLMRAWSRACAMVMMMGKRGASKWEMWKEMRGDAGMECEKREQSVLSSVQKTDSNWVGLLANWKDEKTMKDSTMADSMAQWTVMSLGKPPADTMDVRRRERRE